MLLPTEKKQVLPECCADKRNVVELWPRYDLRLIICKICEHKYYRLFAEPGSLGAMMNGGK